MPTIDKYNDFRTDTLTGEPLRLAVAIREFMRSEDSLYNGGCRAFYSPQEWQERGEMYGTNSALVLCHDGGELSYRCNYGKGQPDEIKRFDDFIRSLGYYVESCTGWYSALYPLAAQPAPETWHGA